MRKLWLICALLVVAGCGAGNGGDDDDDDGASPTPTMPATLDIAATEVELALAFEVDVDGSAMGAVGDVTVTNNSGTIELDGDALPITFYEKQLWTDFGYTLYQGLAVGSSSLDVIWLYCEGSSLSYVWREGVNGPALDHHDASGTCAGTDTPAATTVAYPAFTLETPATGPGYTIDGDDISLPDGETGLVTIDGITYPFVAFEDVDCTECGGDGWHELHSLLWDGAADRLIFVIFYLDFGYPDRVLAAYARSLPDFEDPVGILELDATWTAQPGTALRTTVPRLRP